MFEKDVTIGYLLDFYGELLTERKRQVLDLYYNCDLSLSEIADELGISRQAVRELASRAGAELKEFEQKLKAAEKFRIIDAAAASAAADPGNAELVSAQLELIRKTIKD
ncbi:MAG: DNA-binding protein [Clostridia bacterium]|nr:DNA-binding protein [Clostridia bacterium]